MNPELITEKGYKNEGIIPTSSVRYVILEEFGTQTSNTPNSAKISPIIIQNSGNLHPPAVLFFCNVCIELYTGKL